jgi:hypothetical protein
VMWFQGHSSHVKEASSLFDIDDDASVMSSLNGGRLHPRRYKKLLSQIHESQMPLA